MVVKRIQRVYEWLNEWSQRMGLTAAQKQPLKNRLQRCKCHINKFVARNDLERAWLAFWTEKHNGTPVDNEAGNDDTFSFAAVDDEPPSIEEDLPSIEERVATATAMPVLAVATKVVSSTMVLASAATEQAASSLAAPEQAASSLAAPEQAASSLAAPSLSAPSLVASALTAPAPVPSTNAFWSSVDELNNGEQFVFALTRQSSGQTSQGDVTMQQLLEALFASEEQRLANSQPTLIAQPIDHLKRVYLDLKNCRLDRKIKHRDLSPILQVIFSKGLRPIIFGTGRVGLPVDPQFWVAVLAASDVDRRETQLYWMIKPSTAEGSGLPEFENGSVRRYLYCTNIQNMIRPSEDSRPETAWIRGKWDNSVNTRVSSRDEMSGRVEADGNEKRNTL